MPKKALIEAIVVAAVEAVLSGNRIEDERIECKSELMPPERVRQLAGAANAALGDEVIWIVGVDEAKAQLVPLDSTVDLADWWAKVERGFDDQVSPGLTSMWIPVPNGLVLALHFTTDRAPYAVRNPGGGTPELEVPWRAGTRTRSAKRHELLRTLLPTISIPEVTLLGSEGQISASNGESLSFSGTVELYIEYLHQARIFFPLHKMSAAIAISGEPQDLRVRPRDRVLSQTVTWTDEGFHCSGPGIVQFDVFGDVGRIESSTPDYLGLMSSVDLKLKLPIAGASRAVMVDVRLYAQRETNEPTLVVAFAVERPSDRESIVRTPVEVQHIVKTALEEHFTKSSEYVDPDEVVRMTGLDLKSVQTALRQLAASGAITGVEVAEVDYPLRITSVMR